MNVGMNIRKMREKAGLKQSELASRLGVSDKTISSWEVNRTEPKMGMIEKICVILRCKKTDLIEETQDALWMLAREKAAVDAAKPVMEKYLLLSIEHQLTVQIMIDALLAEEKKEKDVALNA